MLSRPEGRDTPARAGLVYYLVEDIQAAYRQLAGQGVEFLAAPHLIARLPDHDLWMTECRDSEGNLLVLMSEVRGQ